MTSAITTPVCVRLRKNGEVLVTVTDPKQIIRLEGNWYFHPSVMDMNIFHATDKLYTCPYKGTCNWVDLERDKLYIPDVAWVYPETFPAYQHIAGWYGFYTSNDYYETGACDE